MNSLCGNGNVMAAPPTVNAITSNNTTDISSELPSKTSSGVTNTGCKVSLWGTPWTQYIFPEKKVGEAMVSCEVLEVTKSAQCSMVNKTNSFVVMEM